MVFPNWSQCSSTCKPAKACFSTKDFYAAVLTLSGSNRCQSLVLLATWNSCCCEIGKSRSTTSMDRKRCLLPTARHRLLRRNMFARPAKLNLQEKNSAQALVVQDDCWFWAIVAFMDQPSLSHPDSLDDLQQVVLPAWTCPTQGGGVVQAPNPALLWQA